MRKSTSFYRRERKETHSKKTMTTSTFVSAMDALNSQTKTIGENGSPEWNSLIDAKVALFFALVRGLDSDRLSSLLQDVMRAPRGVKKSIQALSVADAFLITFQTRSCRGGKGEKDLFFRMLLELSKDYPITVASLMALVPHYGSYKDWFRIIEWAQDKKKVPEESTRHSMATSITTILNLTKEQLFKDKSILDESKLNQEKDNNSKVRLSLLAKWAPREKKHFGKQAKQLAKLMFPNSQSPNKDYRKLLSELNTAINTTEIKMCSNKWNEIDFGSDVPSICLMKNRKAFLNEKTDTVAPTMEENETGNRHPDDIVRISCRKRLRDTMLGNNAKKIKGRQLFPHEIVSKLMRQDLGKLSTLEKDLFASQWTDIRKSVKEAMETARQHQESLNTDCTSDSLDLGKMVPLVDVSGSMGGVPMQVAIALGILVSELTSVSFADRFLTFSAEPEWVDLTDLSLSEKVRKTMNSPWGYNTNFEAAIEKILDCAVSAKMKPEEIPNLIVFSDMQFDKASGSGYEWHGSGYASVNRSGCGSGSQDKWETHYERLVRRFKETGLDVCGKEWSPPHIIFWNLRGDSNGFPTQSDTQGVTMLSGYSPSLMKLLLNGDSTEVDVEEGGMVVVGGQIVKRDPYKLLRSALDNEEYDKVRNRLNCSQEGLLKFYESNTSENVEEEPIADWAII